MDQSLKSKYTFYLIDSDNLVEAATSWLDQIKEVCSFSSVPAFWGQYQHLVRPQELGNKCEFLLFKDGIQPQWEAPENQEGGRFKLRVKKAHANRFWEELLLLVISEQNSQVNGLIATIKEKEVLFSLWVSKHSEEQRNEVRNWLRTSLGLNDRVEVDYRDHPKPENIIEKEEQ